MAAPDCNNVSKAELARRVSEAIHSSELEGLTVTTATRADAGEYITGQIDTEELVARARARYDLH